MYDFNAFVAQTEEHVSCKDKRVSATLTKGSI